MNKLILGLALSAAPLLSLAADHVVPQKDKAFTVKSLSVKAGDKVVFRNDDTVLHNIFSLTDPMSFDLGTFGQGQSKSVVFSKPGKYEVECAIHPDMKMVVNVAP
jgi:plastocyanin